MEQQDFIILSYFDEEEPRILNRDNLTPQMLSSGIGYNAGFTHDYSTIVYILTNKGFLKEIFDNKNPNHKGLQLASNFHSKGYVLTTPVGVNLLNEEIKKRSKPMTSKEVTNEILKFCCPNGITNTYKTRFIQRELMIQRDLFDNTLIDMKNKGYAVNFIGGMFSIKSKGCMFWNDGGYKSEENITPAHTYNFTGEVTNWGQFGGVGNIQTNIKIEFTNNENFNELKELILDLEDYEAEDLQWKECLSQILNELYRLQLANDKAEQKASESRIDRFLTKFKKLKDWVDITTLPVFIIEKGSKMVELWNSIKALIGH